MKKIVWSLFLIVATVVVYFAYAYYRINAVSRGEKIAEYEAPRRALMIIDLQRDITEKDGRMVMNPEQTDRIIGNINRILSKHGKGDLLVVYITQEFEKNSIVQLLTNNALLPGSPGARIDPRIMIVGDNHFVKHVSDAFSNRGLDDFLVKNRVNHLYVTGVDAEYCVDKTVKAALNRNYKVTVISDAVGSGSDEKRDAKIREFERLGMEIITTEQMLTRM